MWDGVVLVVFLSARSSWRLRSGFEKILESPAGVLGESSLPPELRFISPLCGCLPS